MSKHRNQFWMPPTILLGEISPEELVAKIKSEYAERAMARLVFRFNILLWKNDTLNADGHSDECLRKTEKLAEIEPFSFKADIAVFIALKEEFDLFHRIIAEKANTAFITLGRSETVLYLLCLQKFSLSTSTKSALFQSSQYVLLKWDLSGTQTFRQVLWNALTRENSCGNRYCRVVG